MDLFVCIYCVCDCGAQRLQSLRQRLNPDECLMLWLSEASKVSGGPVRVRVLLYIILTKQK